MGNIVEIYKAETGHKKTYFVSSSLWAATNEAKKYLKCSADHIQCVKGWVVDDFLYLEDPKCKGKKVKFVAFYV